ncbi:hypothetical protein [Streptomyces acidicola]|uniref:hypothetical protein n=1 Tax=Streptomyces acidicola TaxID=2596892 RepID=UPI001D13AAE1|nr:hypothetical protein [Streptomyces acidicola]
MAHPTPVPKTPGRSEVIWVPHAPDLPDVLSERTHTVIRRTLTVAGGLVYGYWTAAINRAGGPITGWNILLGFVSAVAFMVALTGVRALAPRLRRELHATTWAVFAGIAFGFIYSQSGASILRCCLMSLPVAGAVGALTFYRYYTHEDAEGHRNR